MNRPPLLSKPLVVAALLVLSIAPSSSQAPQPKSTLETLKTMKATGQELLGKQEKTLQTLDAVLKAAEQIRIFAKRT